MLKNVAGDKSNTSLRGEVESNINNSFLKKIINISYFWGHYTRFHIKSNTQYPKKCLKLVMLFNRYLLKICLFKCLFLSFLKIKILFCFGRSVFT